MTQVSRPLNYCCWDNEMSLWVEFSRLIFK
jgi:hypothetical protein